MELEAILKYILAVVSVLIILAVVLQNRGGGLSNVFGGSGGGEQYRSKRGLEAVLYNGTIILTIIFVVISIAIAILSLS